MITRVLLLSLLMLGLNACNQTINKGGAANAPTPISSNNSSDADSGSGKLGTNCQDLLDYATVKTKVLDVSCVGCHKNTFSTYAKAKAKAGDLQDKISSGEMPDMSGGAITWTQDEKDFILKWLAAGAPETATPAPGCNDSNGTPAPAPTPVQAPSAPTQSPTPAPTPSVTPTPSAPTSSPTPAPTATPTPSPGNPGGATPVPTTPPTTPSPTPEPSSGADPRANYEWLNANVFTPKCAKCHSPDGDASDADFTTYNAMMSVNDTDGIFDYDHPEQSSIVVKVMKVGKGQMPPTSSNIPRLTDDEVSVLTAWIRARTPEKL